MECACFPPAQGFVPHNEEQRIKLMGWQVKAPDDLSDLMTWTHMVEKENCLPQVVLTFPCTL